MLSDEQLRLLQDCSRDEQAFATLKTLFESHVSASPISEFEQARLNAITNASFDAIIAFTLDGTVTAWNVGAHQIYGYAPEEIIGQSIFVIVPADYETEMHTFLHILASGQSIAPRETIRVTKTGQRIPMLITLSPIKDSQGQIIGISSIGHDISAQKRLAEEQAHLTAIVNSSADAIIAWTLDGKITRWSAGAQDMFGYLPEEVIGKPISQLLPDHLIEKSRRYMEQLIRGRSIQQILTTNIRKDGTALDILATLVPIKNAADEVVGAASIRRDVTQLTALRKAFEATETLFRAIIATMGEGIILYNKDGNIQMCNPAAERILGLTQDEMTGRVAINPDWRGFHDNLTPFNLEEHPARIALSSGQPVSNVLIGVQKSDQSLVWILMNAHPLFNESDTHPDAVVTSFADVTQLREMRHALDEKEIRLKSILQHIPDILWSVDLKNPEMVYYNQAGTDILGASVGLFPKDSAVSEYFASYDPQESQDFMEEVLKHGKAKRQFRVPSPDGGIQWWTNRGWLVADENGIPMRVEGIVRDVTDEQRARNQEFELELERERVFLLRDFISNTSHELRTPLSVISTVAYNMARQPDSLLRIQKQHRIEEQVSYLSKMIDQMQEMVKLSQTKQLNHELLSLNAIVKAIVAEYTPRKKGVHLLLALSPENPQIHGEANHIRYILKELLDNAVSASQENMPIFVSTTVSAGEVQLTVEDKGIGIAAEHLERIFDYFYKVDPARQREGQGVGMGLAMVKRIMELHGGYMTVDSRLNEGSIFTANFERG